VNASVNLRDLFEKYHRQVQFLSIYINEAHPVDGWWLGRGFWKWAVKLYSPKVAMDINAHKTMEERRKAAGQCEDTLQYGIHTYVDEMDDSVSKAYAAYPTRLYLVGVDGKVVYAAGLGPFGFHPRELGEAIEKYLKT
jgi:Iodothyronine deiodinase